MNIILVTDQLNHCFMNHNKYKLKTQNLKIKKYFKHNILFYWALLFVLELERSIVLNYGFWFLIIIQFSFYTILSK